VLERHPEGERVLDGYLWLDGHGQPLHVQARELEFTDEPPG
jgi:hypothetical protein